VDPANLAHLAAEATRLRVPLDDNTLGRLDRLVALLLQWNEKINLTAVTEPRQIVERHLLDSLAVVAYLESLEAIPGEHGMVDLGSGGGFPGLVVRLARPTWKLTSVESIQKKIAFQQAVDLQLRLGMEFLRGREEELRGKRLYDVAVSRATWDPPDWILRGVHWVNPGGVVVAMLTADAPALLAPVGCVLLPEERYEIGRVVRRLAGIRVVPRGTESSKTSGLG